MAQVFINGYAKDTNNLFFGVANTNFPYIVKVTDPAKFRMFAQAIAGNETKAKKYNAKYESQFRNPDPFTNETNFLEMIKTYAMQNGMALYKSTTNCSSWVQLKLGVSGSIEVPCE